MAAAESFSKKEHIIKSREFRDVYTKGVSFRKGAVILYTMPNGLGWNRLGFSISARNVKRATRRNRIKRLFREAYRRTKSKTNSGHDIFLIIKKDDENVGAYKQAEKILLGLLKKAGITQ
ncbi:MAG: ribonuclease P protein component [Candidatus Omnitrophica bacterium]|nr:ribonuclease P protein component [Candidatus Omnitrophota bacterium]